MRKFTLLTIFLLSVLLLLSACSGNDESPSDLEDPIVEQGNDDVGEQTDDEDKQDDQDKQDIGDRLSAAYVNIMKGENYTMKYRTIMDIDGREMDANITLVVAGERTAFKMETESISTTTIIEEKKMHLINHEAKMVMVMPIDDDIIDDNDALEPQDIDAVNMEYVGNGTRDFMGSDRHYEEYKVDDGRVFYYFDGKDLVGMEMIAEDSSLLIELESMTDKVDESIFEIPEGYQTMGIPG